MKHSYVFYLLDTRFFHSSQIQEDVKYCLLQCDGSSIVALTLFVFLQVGTQHLKHWLVDVVDEDSVLAVSLLPGFVLLALFLLSSALLSSDCSVLLLPSSPVKSITSSLAESRT
mmetsp:Transcript_23580/g.40254  ORF Transcript_23580/g.40254 Transcript_23580/m.40254 type:complete len:114 (+) Transcript_23580:600-941(+)